MSDDPSGQVPVAGPESRSDRLDDLTDEVLPALIARLRASGLGELEVRTGAWRVRLRRDGRAARAAGSTLVVGEAEDDVLPAADGSVARSPAVGYFMPATELTVGRSVGVGDLLGSVDVLGIAQEVTAPASGIVSSVLAEDGQAVEYGQALADIDPLEIETDDLLDEVDQA